MLNPIANRSLSESVVNRAFNNTNNNALAVVNRVNSADREQQNSNQIQQLNSLRLDESNRTNSRINRVDDNSSQSSRSTRANSNQRFVLSAEQSASLSSLRSGEREQQSVSNSSIGQYLSTQNLEIREEIESLVGVDLLV